MLSILKKISMIASGVALVSCSSSDDNSAAPNAFASAKTALESAAPDVSSTAFFAANPRSLSPRAAITPIFTTSNQFADPDGGSSVNSLVQYVEKMYSDSVDNAVFTRANSPFLIACSLDALLAKTGRIPNNGTQSLVINVASLSACGTADDYTGAGGSMDGETITAIVESVSDTTYFDSRITMTGASNPIFGGNDQYMYYRNDGTSLNIAHYEMDSSGSPTSVSASWLKWNIATGSGSFQYISRNSSVRNMYRIAFDAVGNDARIFTYTLNDPLVTAQMMMTSAASTTTSQTQAAFSFSWDNQTAADTTDGNACLNISGLATIAADDTLTCSGNAKTVAATSTSTPIITRAMTTLSIANIAGYGSASATGDSIMPNFDGTNILTSITGW